MNKRVLVYPYVQGSAGAKALAESLGVKRARRMGAAIIKADVLINWGSSKIHRRFDGKILNTPENVRKAANKLTTLKILQEAGVPLPPFTESIVEASKWLPKHSVFCRTKLSGHSGDGIVVANNEQELVEAPLYTRYIKKKEEFRVHVIGGKVVFLQRKARKKDVPDDQVNWQVRNLKGGFIYQNQNVEIPQNAQDICVKAVEALSLDFGAVDLILGTDKKFYVLEVNTACGLTGTTLERYSEHLKPLCDAF